MVEIFSGLEPLKLSYQILPKQRPKWLTGNAENYSEIWIFQSVLLRYFGLVKTSKIGKYFDYHYANIYFWKE